MTNNPKQNIIPSIPLICTPIKIAIIVNNGLIPTFADTSFGSNICLSNDNEINTTDIL